MDAKNHAVHSSNSCIFEITQKRLVRQPFVGNCNFLRHVDGENPKRISATLLRMAQII